MYTTVWQPVTEPALLFESPNYANIKKKKVEICKQYIKGEPLRK